MNKLNGRQWTFIQIIISASFLVVICIWGSLNADIAITSDFGLKNVPPETGHIFGTDWLGRDMFARTLRGLSISILIGIITAGISAFIALTLGIIAATGGRAADAVISFITDIVMGIPHILLLILICVAVGRGLPGIIIGVSLTHWPSLARLIRGEVMQLKESPYIKIAEKLGKSKFYIAKKHILPHLFPQFTVGLILLFPHAVLHEASVTFLGFGLSAGQPAIGNILSESMKYLITGKWWLAVFPGIFLVITVLLFYLTGQGMRKLMDPNTAHM